MRKEKSNGYKILEELSPEFKLYGDKILNKLNTDFEDYIGWMKPMSSKSIEVKKIKRVAEEVKNNSEVFVVVGIGGSYLGARAVIEALTNKFKKEIEIIYLGNSLSALDMKETLEYLETKDFTINVISKSGTTLETEIAFSFLKELLFKKYDKENALKRIIITTDKHNGKLRTFVNETNVESFIIPEDVGGRYSVLTAVGLLPIAVAGIDIDSVLEGAESAANSEESFSNSLFYASYRYNMYSKGKEIDLLTLQEPRLKYLGEWWKQLFGESEGKNGKGLFPATAIYSTDLHSIGQLIQDGKRNLFQTNLSIEADDRDIQLNLDMGEIAGLEMSELNNQMKDSALKAHSDGGVPSVTFHLGKLNEKTIGEAIQFFMVSCAVSAIILGVNPFDQPGVEEYKKNMREFMNS